MIISPLHAQQKKTPLSKKEVLALAQQHQSVAVLPVMVELEDIKLPSRSEQTAELMGWNVEALENGLQSFYADKLYELKMKGKMNWVNIQDPSTTTKLLAELGVENAEDLRSKKMGELAEHLGVDALISGYVFLKVELDADRSVVLMRPDGKADLYLNMSSISESGFQLWDATLEKRIWSKEHNYYFKGIKPPYRITEYNFSNLIKSIPYNSKLKKKQ